MNLIKALISLLLTIGRIFIIYKISVSLYYNFETPFNVFNGIQWYICALILDLYLMNLENHLSSDIYYKKSDGEKGNSGN